MRHAKEMGLGKRLVLPRDGFARMVRTRADGWLAIWCSHSAAA